MKTTKDKQYELRLINQYGDAIDIITSHHQKLSKQKQDLMSTCHQYLETGEGDEKVKAVVIELRVDTWKYDRMLRREYDLIHQQGSPVAIMNWQGIDDE